MVTHGPSGAVPHYHARIVDTCQETPRIRTFVLDCGDQPFAFRAGQWIDLFVEIDGRMQVGGYSMTSAPSAAPQFELAIQSSPRHAVTRWLHETARVDDEVVVSAGQGEFVFEAGMGRRVVLLGAGIGVTPLVSIFRHAAEVAPDIELLLVHSAVSADELPFAAELAATAARLPGFRYVPTLTGEDPRWQGERGRIDAAMLARLGAPVDARHYFCGARAFIEDMHALLTQRGVPGAQQVFEKWW
ncbi:MAG TPA: oxidoreductase [Thioalkalivibrio sp.]|nr:oxidoreductase [Thioalkalivibrio sp.]